MTCGKIERMPRFSVKCLLVVTLLVAVALFVGLSIIDNAQVACWIGHFSLQVDLVDSRQFGIADVASQVFSSTDYAKYVRTAPDRLELDLEHVDWTPGKPFSVQVRTTGRRSSWRELSYSQYRLLVLRVTYQDGSVEWIPVEMPDGRANRHVSVSTAQYPPSARKKGAG